MSIGCWWADLSRLGEYIFFKKGKRVTMGRNYESWEMIWDRRVGGGSVHCINGFWRVRADRLESRYLYIPAMIARTESGCHTDVTGGTGCRSTMSSTMKSLKKSLVRSPHFRLYYTQILRSSR